MKNQIDLVRCAIITLSALAVLGGCSGSTPSGPRETVIAFFGAMEKDDKGSLAHLLDLAELMKNTGQDYALQSDEARRFTNPVQILEDLTGEGLTKKRWFALQRIVNRAEISGETAKIEVTFVDKNSSEGYRTKFGLHIINGKWKIYSFKAI